MGDLLAPSSRNLDTGAGPMTGQTVGFVTPGAGPDPEEVGRATVA